MSTQFLPNDYIAPRTNGSYTKLINGTNKIRILSHPILGWEDWIDNKPVRYPMDERPSSWNDPARPGKHFWAIIIWNYQEERIQIFHVTQGSIRKAIEDLSKDSDWGAPFFYDIKITREGEGLKTKYTVNPLPHKAVESFVKEAFDETPCNLDALFDGNDPFGLWETYTKGVFSKEGIKEKENPTMSENEFDAFLDQWSIDYDKNDLLNYIDRRSHYFKMNHRETAYVLSEDLGVFEREFNNWLSKQSKLAG